MKPEKYTEGIKKQMESQQIISGKIEKQRKVSSFFKHPFVLALLTLLLIPVVIAIIDRYTPLHPAQDSAKTVEPELSEKTRPLEK